MGFMKPKQVYQPPVEKPAAPPTPPQAADSGPAVKGAQTRSNAMGGLASTILTGSQGLADTANRAKKNLTGQ